VPKSPSKGLSENLANECSAIGAEIRIYEDVASCLQDLEKHVTPLDNDTLANVVELVLITSGLDKAAADRKYRFTSERIGASISPFATEKPDTLALTFELTYRLVDLSDDDNAPRLEPTLTAKGNCFYNLSSKAISTVQTDAEIFRWKDVTGQQFTNTNHYAYASASIVLGGMTMTAPPVRPPVK
jgi:hypothetical protein